MAQQAALRAQQQKLHDAIDELRKEHPEMTFSLVFNQLMKDKTALFEGLVKVLSAY